MDSIKEKVLQLCKTITDKRNAGVVMARNVRSVKFADGTYGQIQITVVTAQSDFKEDSGKTPEFDVLKEGVKTGTDYFADERIRHVDILGYTAEHDDEHVGGELAIAAACYAVDETTAKVVAPNGSDAWPLEPAIDKRDRLDRFRKIVIAGGLLAAEAERELRIIEKVNVAEES